MNYCSVSAIGRLTADPELNYTKSGKPVAKFTIAVNDKPYNGADQVSFFNCQTWAKSAENMALYCKKGDLIHISGRPKQERWEKDGKKNSRIIFDSCLIEYLKTKNSNQDYQDNADNFETDPSYSGTGFTTGEEIEEF